MSGHTPGPWVAEAYENLAAARADGCFEWADPTSTGDCFEGGPVGAVYLSCEDGGTTGLPGSIETSLANARLIAAAPEYHAAALLEEATTKHWDECERCGLDVVPRGCTVYLNLRRDAEIARRAAIAKADGR